MAFLHRSKRFNEPAGRRISVNELPRTYMYLSFEKAAAGLAEMKIAKTR